MNPGYLLLSICIRETYIEEKSEVRVSSLYSCYFLLKFVELELVKLTLKQGEIYLAFARSNFDLVYLNGGSFVGVFTHAGLDELVIIAL
jgi:hypothetical protein